MATANEKPVVPTPSAVECQEQHKLMTDNKLKEQKVNCEKIDVYVKMSMFKRVRFYNIQWDCYEDDPKSICQKICKGLNVLESKRQLYWNTYCVFVDHSIKVARNNAIAAVMSSFFKGK